MDVTCVHWNTLVMSVGVCFFLFSLSFVDYAGVSFMIKTGKNKFLILAL